MANNFSQLSTQVETLKHEVRALRSLLIGLVGKDKEGGYNPSFVRKILKASKERPTYTFDPKTFLSQLKKV